MTKPFGEVTAVHTMTLRIAGGAFYGFLGPSGCGKTTTLRMVAGLEQPDAGEILLDDQPIAGVPPCRRNVNTVFPYYALFPHEPATGRATVETGAGLRIGGEVTDRDARPAAGAKVTVAIRPERLRVAAPRQGVPGATEAGWLRAP